MKKYFEDIKQECITECRKHTYTRVSSNAFSNKDIIQTIKKQGENDSGHKFIISIIKKTFKKEMPKNILIAGCGSGELAQMIHKTFPKSEMTLIDKEKDMIILNKKRNNGKANMEAIQTDILEYTPKKKFDLIVAYGVFRYIPEEKRKKVINNWNKILEKGGKIIVGEGGAEKIIDDIQSNIYKKITLYRKKAKLFRLSLFYVLYNKFQRDNEFNKIVRQTGKYKETLEKIAGKVEKPICIKVLHTT